MAYNRSRLTDTTTLILFLKGVQKHLKFKYKNITADAGYGNEENHVFLEANGQISYVKTADYEILKTRKYRNDIGRIENMEYYADLTSIHDKCEDCYGCPYKNDCIKGNNCKTPLEERTKRLQVAKTFLKYRQEDLKRILSDKGTLLSTNWSILAEGSFGNLKQDMQSRRYMSKGT